MVIMPRLLWLMFQGPMSSPQMTRTLGFFACPAVALAEAGSAACAATAMNAAHNVAAQRIDGRSASMSFLKCHFRFLKAKCERECAGRPQEEWGQPAWFANQTAFTAAPRPP